MKIAIDCRALRNSPSGIPNYLVSAISAIASQNPDWKLYLLANESFHKELESQLPQSTNVIYVISPLKIIKNLGILWYVLKVSSILKKLNPNIFWAPNFLLPPSVPNGIKTISTVHDTVFKQYKSTMSLANRLFFELLFDQSVNKADMLWAVSEYTKSEIENFFPNRKCKDIFVGSSINNTIFRKINVSTEEKRALPDQFSIGEKFILFVGTLEPRKNLSFLLSLMPELAQQGYSLLVVGAKGWGKTHIRQIIEAPGYPKERVAFSGFLTTEELVKIYNIAAIYVSTSKNEGFGLPQLEAMACGCPVVSPHNSAMVEVVAGAGETVNTWNKVDWITAINKVYNDREKYIKLGFLRAEENRWEKIVTKLNSYINQHIA